MPDKLQITVIALNISPEKGTAKTSVPSVEIDRKGVVGDAHRGTAGRNVSLLNRKLVDELAASSEIDEIPCGAMGENITFSISGCGSPATGDTVRIGEVLMRIETIGKQCKGEGCSIFQAIGRCVMPAYGIFCSVSSGGTLRTGMSGEIIPGID